MCPWDLLHFWTKSTSVGSRARLARPPPPSRPPNASAVLGQGAPRPLCLAGLRGAQLRCPWGRSSREWL